VAQAVVAQLAEQWQISGPLIPATKDSGVVKVRVTSAKEQSGGRRKGCGLETRLLCGGRFSDRLL